MIYWRCQLRLSFFSFFSAASSWMIDYCRSFRCGFPFFPERLTPQATEKSSSQGRFGCCFLCEVLRFFLVISTYYPNICSGIWWYNNIISWGRSPKAATRTDSPFFTCAFYEKSKTSVAPSPRFFLLCGEMMVPHLFMKSLAAASVRDLLRRWFIKSLTLV